MSSITPNEIKQEFIKSKIGIAGVGILVILVIISVTTIAVIPNDTLKEWNNPVSWISHPKTAVPVWVNYFLSEKIPEHMILDAPNVSN